MSDDHKKIRAEQGLISAPVQATINDVAGLAGVSIKTVSRVMNNEPNVREETRERVRCAALSLNYTPNLLARSLAGSRSFMVALLYDNPVPSYIFAMHNGVVARLRRSGYHLLAEPLDENAPDLDKQIKLLISTIPLDGVILTPPLCDSEVILSALEAAQIPYVRVSPFVNPDRSSRVFMDEKSAAFQMTSYLIEQGHKDIGFVHGHPKHGGSHRRYEGFYQAMSDHGLVINPDWVKPGQFSYESGLEAGRSFFASATRPSAIFASNDYMAFGIMTIAQQMDIKIPDELSIVGFDDAPGSILIWPHLSTIRQPVHDIAYQAAEILLDKSLEKKALELPFELIKRSSTSPHHH